MGPSLFESSANVEDWAALLTKWFLFDVGVGWSNVLEVGVSTSSHIPGPNPSSDPHHPRVPHLAHVERPRPKSYRGPSTIKVNIGLPRL